MRPSSEIRQTSFIDNKPKITNNSSEKKPQMTVVYDEFKYFSRPFDLDEEANKIEMVSRKGSAHPGK